MLAIAFFALGRLPENLHLSHCLRIRLRTPAAYTWTDISIVNTIFAADFGHRGKGVIIRNHHVLIKSNTIPGR
jgi:hypothetical protein